MRRISTLRLIESLLRRSRNGVYKMPLARRLLAYNEYGMYCVPEESRDRPACQSILGHYVWEPDTIEFIRENCGDGDIVHAGTFFGDFLPALSAGLHDGCVVHAFEPVLENYRCARITLEINDLPNVRLSHGGLAAHGGTARVRTRSEDGACLGGNSKISVDGTQPTQLYAIDEAVEDRVVSIIQLDVEGSEQVALEGALRTIDRCAPIIILENQPGLFASDWFRFQILGRGYKATRPLHDNTVFSRQNAVTAA